MSLTRDDILLRQTIQAS